MGSIDRDAVKANGWGLGKFFTTESASNTVNLIADEHKAGSNIFIAVTHDCSVIMPSLEKEPYLEYLSVSPIDKENGQFTNARNIRHLHFEVEVEGELRWYEATMGMRGFVSRASLDECSIDERYKLTDASMIILKRWLANRYISQTFPDKFNHLTRKLVEGSKAPLIKAFNTEIGKACNSIFISLTPDDRDIQDGESYGVIIALLFREELAIEIGRESMDEFGARVQSILESVDGLDPVKVHALAETDATYSEIVKMSRWQLDYVSIKDGAEILSVDHSS
ncbi:hypothetical protein ACJJID_02420 [Microbulbifer sp. CnH-101-G]|uniref:hypothetical protein n=1 Tax=Microbulbifer sp. CnH-101-G TaxID=3243393 RepID=UPI0040395B18